VNISPLSDGDRRLTAGYQAIVDYLRRQVTLGRLGPGDKLPAERKLAETLGVARETLRQALRVLEGAGEISVQRGASGGAFITALESNPEARTSALRGRRNEVLELVQFRDIVESASARLAAEAVTPNLLDRLDDALADLSAATTLAQCRRADTIFHLAIAEGSGNSLLVHSVEEARIRMFEPVDALAVTFIKNSSLVAHQAIRDAIAHHDSAQAELEMREHLAITAAEFDRLIKD